MGDVLTRRVKEESAEKGNFDTVAHFELLLKNSSSSNPPVEQDEQLVKISELSSAISSPAIHKMFLCYLEQPGLIVSTWIPIIVSISENRWLHMFTFTHDQEAHPSLESCFVKYAKSQRLFFEDELSNYINPLLSSEKPQPKQSSSNNKMKTMNATLKKLDDHVTLEDIETNKVEQMNR